MGNIGVDWEVRVDWDELRRSRVARATEAIVQAGLDGILVQRWENMRYLTSMRGFTSMLYHPRYGAFLSASGDVTMMTEAGDLAIANDKMPWLKDVRLWAYDTDENVSIVSGILADRGISKGRIGLDDCVSPIVVLALQAKFPNLEFVDASDALAAARGIKQPEEVKVLREAATIAEIGMAAARDSLTEGIRECEVAGEMVRAMAAAGADALITYPQVTTDAYRRMATDSRVRYGDLVLVDINVGYNGYVGDFARTFVIGKGNDKQKHVFSTQVECLERAIGLVKAGVDPQAVHDVVRQTVKRAGLETHWHSYITGHGVGMGIGPWEQPLIGDTMGVFTELREGMVIACEPGFFDPAIGPVRNENMVLVTTDGSDLLTKFGFEEKLL